MEENIKEGYHITPITNLASICEYGLTPRIGVRSKSVNDKFSLISFTSKLEYVIIWLNRLSFNNNKDKIVILKLDLGNIKNGFRYDSCSDDYFTEEAINPERIKIIMHDNNISLQDIKSALTEKSPSLEHESLKSYYLRNIDKLLEIELDDLLNKADIIIEELKEIENIKPIAEDRWDFHNTDPNLYNIVNFLLSVRKSKNINNPKLIEKVIEIKNKTLSILLKDDLNILESSYIYRQLLELFNDCLYNNKKYNYKSDEYIMKLLCINMFTRQTDRYNRTGKKYDENHKIGYFDPSYLLMTKSEYLNSNNNTNEFEEELFNETINLIESFQAKRL